MNPLANSMNTLWILLLILPFVSCDDWSDNEAWRYGFGAAFLVSSIGFIMSGVVIVMLKIKVRKSKLMVGIFIAFAVGALLGDVLFHIVPDIYSASDSGKEEAGSGEQWKDGEVDPEVPKAVQPTTISLMLLMGILAFSILEIVMSSIGIKHSHGEVGDDEEEEEEGEGKGGHHNHSHHDHDHKHHHHHKKVPALEPTKSPENTGEAVVEVEFAPEVSASTKDNSPTWLSSWKNKRAEGWLNLISSFIHNILDGIAIGVAFMSKNKHIAITTWVAIIAHEIPRELGDMGILINANFNNVQALFCNGFINFSALIGCFIGLGIGSINENSEKIVLSFIAGNFLYIACVDMIPQLLKDSSMFRKFAYVITAVVSAAIMWTVTLAESA